MRFFFIAGGRRQNPRIMTLVKRRGEKKFFFAGANRAVEKLSEREPPAASDLFSSGVQAGDKRRIL